MVIGLHHHSLTQKFLVLHLNSCNLLFVNFINFNVIRHCFGSFLNQKKSSSTHGFGLRLWRQWNTRVLDLEASNSMETSYNNRITSHMNFKFQSLNFFCKSTMCKVLMILDFIVLHVESSFCCDSCFTRGAFCLALIPFNKPSFYFPCI